MEFQVDKKTKTISQVKVLRALHHSMGLSLVLPSAVALKGISCPTKDGNRLMCHLNLTSYIADLPEGEDMLIVEEALQPSLLSILISVLGTKCKGVQWKALRLWSLHQASLNCSMMVVIRL